MKNFFQKLCFIFLLLCTYFIPINMYANDPDFYEIEYWVNILDSFFESDLKLEKSEEVSRYDIVSDEDTNSTINLYQGSVDFSLLLYERKGLGKLPFALSLTYKNDSHYETALGKNMILNVGAFLTQDQNGNITFHDGAMGTYIFEDQFFGYGENFLLGAELESEGSGYRIVFADSKSYHFDDTGKLIAMKDGYGTNQITLSYTAQNLVSITDTIGNTYIFTYTGEKLTEISLLDGDTIEFTYTGDMLSQVAWKNGTDTRTNSFEYIADRLHRIKNALNDTVLENTYDTHGKITSQFNGENTNTYVYGTDSSGRLTRTVTNASGTDTMYTFNSDGTVKQKEIIRSGTNSLYKYEYYGNGLLKNEIFPYFNGYNYRYDSEGNLIEKRFKAHIRNADSSNDQVTTYTYDPILRLPTVITDPEGNTETISYNTQGDILERKITNASGDIELQKNYNYYISGHMYTSQNAGEEAVVYVYLGGTGYPSEKTQGQINTTYTYDIHGNMLSETDTMGNASSYLYNEFHELVSETSPEGVVTNYSYDSVGNLLEESRKIGTNFASTLYEYNTHGDITKLRQEQSEGNFRETNYSYANDDALVTQVETIGGGKTTYEYNETGKITKQRAYNNGKINTTTYTYDKADRLKQEIDDDGYKIYYYYDDFNNLEKKKYPDNSYYLYQYDKNGQNIQEEVYNQDGTMLSRQQKLYNSLGQVTQTKDFFGEESRNLVTTYLYNLNGKVQSTTYSNVGTQNNNYDNLGRIISEESLNGTTYHYTYDVNNNLIEKRLAGGSSEVITLYVYDDDNRLTQEITGNIIKNYTYNSLGQLIQTQIGSDIPQQYTYDYLGNILEEKQGSIVTTYEYDVHGNMKKVTDPNGNISEYIHDDRGNITQHIYPDNSTTNYSYNDKGQKIQRIDALGTTVDYVYDKLGRLNHTYISKGTNVDGVSYEKYEYDVLGRLTYAKNYDSELFFEYDTLSRLTQETNHGKTLNYTYDDLGNRTSITYPNGRVIDYEYVAGERLGEIQVDGSSYADYTYSGYSLDSITYGNATKNSYTYDDAARLDTLVSKNLGTNAIISDFSYEYDLKGNITKDDEREYFYDANNRLEEIYQDKYINANGYNVTKGVNYDYDSAGNRLQRTPFVRGDNGTTNWETQYDITNYDVNTLNQYTNYTTTDDGIVEADVDFLYDAIGNLIQDDKYKYYYDYKNRLTKLEYLDTGYRAYSYRYDPLGRRVYREKQTQRVDYYYAGENSILEEWKDTDTNGNILSTTTYEYINGNTLDDVLARITTDDNTIETTHYYHKNHLGSIVAVTDSTGTVIEKYQYDEFGDPKIWDNTTQEWEWYESPINNTRLFTGREYNTYSKLYYNRARYYAPRLGVFISRDPIDIADDVNLYAYVKNRPVMFTDPRGNIAIALPAIFAPQFTVTTINVLGAGLALHYQDDIQNVLTFSQSSSQLRYAPKPKVQGGSVGSNSISTGAPTPGGKGPKKKGKKGQNVNQDKELSPGEIKKLEKRGLDIHDIKKFGKSKMDLFKDKFGEIYIKRKTGRGYSEPEYIGHNIRDFY